MRHESLITEIEYDAIDDTVPVATVLRKCVLLGSRSGSESLRDWASRELEGYLGYEGVLPRYRVIQAPLMVDGATMTGHVQRQQIPASSIPEFAREFINETLELRYGAGELEAFLAGDEVKLQPLAASDLVRLMNAEGPPGQHITSLYWSVAPGAIRGVLDHIRTALTKLVAELRAAMPRDQDLPTSEQANQAVTIMVTGRRPNVSVNTAHATGDAATAMATASAPPTPEIPWTLWRKVGAFIVGTATVAGAVLAATQIH
jgi:hypothetical protein